MKLNHSLKAKITDSTNGPCFCICINGIPHIQFKKNKYIGMQSWYESKNDFRIEIYLKGCTIKTTYNSFEKWKTILNIINSQI